MFRLLKLMAFALFGYAVYEFFRGMSGTGGTAGTGVGQSFRELGRDTSEAFGRISGSGEGREEETLDADGGSVRHRVGRGVTSGM
jgi:hypothetical protein